MKHNPEISVIIPIYNAEKFLRRGLDSILAQSYTDWECLLIDDGSTDESGRICDEYATIDERFRVFHKTNGGVSSARNLGLDKVRGEWITFIDADDLISNNYFDAIENSNVDIIFTESLMYFPETSKYVNIFSESLRVITDMREYKEVLITYIQNLAYRTPWGKFIKRSLIGDTRFELGQKLGEDTLFVYKIYKTVASVQFVNHSTYYYRFSDIPETTKYKLDVNTGILYLSRIYKAYRDLEILNPNVENFFLSFFFKLLDREDLSNNSQKWFSDPLIKEIEKYAIPLWGKRRIMEYYLWKRPRIAKTYYSILGFLRSILK